MTAQPVRPGEISDTVAALLHDKFIDILKPGKTADADVGSFFEVPVDAMPESVPAKFRDEAEKGLLSLERSGYYIGVAQQAASQKAPNNGSKYSILLIEDNVQFVAAVTRPLSVGGSLLSDEDARREAEELLAQFTILYPTESLVRSAIRGWATYQLSWFDAHVWAYAHEYGLSDIYSEDFQHDRLYGTVRAINPFV